MSITNKKLEKAINSYIEKNWDDIVEDINSVVQIPSYADEEGSDYTKEFPTGKAPAMAMKETLKIAKKLGYKTKNHKNHVGFADILGKSKKMVGFIGHCDVVAEGFGWKFNPYQVTRHDGYLIGRGVVDDKGPNIVVLHAISLLKKIYEENNMEFPYTVRYILGTDEENGMTDIDAYLENYEEPSVVVSPDADFPVCYGETGLTRVKITSPKIANGQYKHLWGGTSDNAVPGYSRAIVKLKRGQVCVKQGSRLAHVINIEPMEDGLVQITAKGRSAHACTPYEGLDSIAILSQFLIEQNIGTKEELEFIKFIAKVAGKPSGNEIGLDCRDDYFGDLTVVTTMLRKEDNHFSQVFDVRFPTTITLNKINKTLLKAAPKGSTLVAGKADTPFLIDPESEIVKALSKSYEDATSKDGKIFTMSGSTYARHFKCATSFGPEMPWDPKPAWVGNIHGADEGISEKNLKETLKIYVYATHNLMNLDLD